MAEEFPIDQLPEEDLFDIDIEAINIDSEKEANSMIQIVTNLYQDEGFKKKHPQAQRRIEMELETLRGLIKMRKVDEEAQDAIIEAISANKSNGSLYRSLSDIQKTSIALSNKIHDTIDRLSTICKDFQHELPIEEEIQDNKPVTGATRGTKAFIEEMSTKKAE